MDRNSVRGWWKEHSESLCRLGEVFLSFGSGVLTIICFGSPFWIEDDESHNGLWQCCTGTPKSKCSPLLDPSAAVLGARAMLVLALVCGLIGWAISMVSLVLHRPSFLCAAGSAFGLQSFFLFIGLLVYTKEINSSLGSQGWSYSIGWIGFFVAAVSAIIFTLVALYRYRNPDTTQRTQQIYAPLSQWNEPGSSDSDEDL